MAVTRTQGTPAGPPPERLLRRVEWSGLDPAARRAWLDGLRAPQPDANASDILASVRRGGDAALRELTRRFDGASIDRLFVDEAAFDAAEAMVEPELRAAFEQAAAAINRFHADQRNALRARRVVQPGPGVTAWRRWVPIRRAGGYVPGGLAAYPSSVLMLGIPAREAGVDELIIATPPLADGSVNPAVLVAARLVGITRVLRVGGAQAIAALAYGTESVPAVDKIFGAGNAWVTAAKRAVAAEVAIDLPAGPSECVIIADAGADPELVALDLLAQAEHGPDSVALLVTDATALANAVEERLPRIAAPMATGQRALETLRAWGAAVIVDAAATGLEVAEAVAPEHLSLQTADAERLAARVRAAGAVFIGPWSAVAAGDYATGTNHVLPTGGAARAVAGVGVESFGHWVEVQRLEEGAARRIGPVVEAIASAEGLPLHAASVAARARLAGERRVRIDPLSLLRNAEPVEAYPAEPSDARLAEELGLPEERIVRYDLNTLGGGPLPGAAAALAAYDAGRAVEYGDLAYVDLRQRLGELMGVDPSRVVMGAGADELIRLVATMTLGPGDASVIPVPTFGMFAVEVGLAGARIVSVPRAHPAERQAVELLRGTAESEAARLVWLCTPNNPTGDLYPLDEIRRLAEGLPAVVLVDEVYLEFAEAAIGSPPNAGSAIRLQDELPNVWVLRSLAKAYGLAGARVGYLVVPEPLAGRFDASRLPLSVAGPSEAMALGALADPEAARRRHRELMAERNRLATALSRRGCEVLTTLTNFVTFRPPDAPSLARALAVRGLILREYPSGPMAGWLRATARARDENDLLITALEELLP